jgi:hypothetical protein
MNILNQAADLLASSPTAHTKHQLARDKNNRPVGTASPDACSWCMQGAIWNSVEKLGLSGHLEKLAYDDAMALVRQCLPNTQDYPWQFNDAPTTTTDDVIAVLRKAAAL